MDEKTIDDAVVARAEELRQNTSGMTFDEAVDQVLEKEPGLYSIYVQLSEPQERDPKKRAKQFAESVVLDEARERAKAKGIRVSEALDQVLEEQPELYSEAVGEPTAKLTEEQHSELQRYRELD